MPTSTETIGGGAACGSIYLAVKEKKTLFPSLFALRTSFSITSCSDAILPQPLTPIAPIPLPPLQPLPLFPYSSPSPFDLDISIILPISLTFPPC